MTLPYKPDDDQAADRFINTALRNPTADTWRHLASDLYVEQTARVLLAMLDRIKVSGTHRLIERDVARARLHAGEITQAEYSHDVAQDGERAKKTAHFEALVLERYRLLEHKVHELRGDTVRDELLDLVLALGTAIHSHRAAVLLDEFEPTENDRALWARLTALTVPDTADGRTRAPLDDLVKQHVAASETTDEQRALAGIILDLPADTTSIARAALLAIWKTSQTPTPDRHSSPRAPGRTRRSPKAELFNQALRGLERRGLVARRGAGQDQHIEVLNRYGLARLRCEQEGGRASLSP